MYNEETKHKLMGMVVYKNKIVKLKITKIKCFIYLSQKQQTSNCVRRKSALRTKFELNFTFCINGKAMPDFAM